MLIDTNQILTMTEVNQNFSKAVKVADKNGSAVIFKNNKPKYLLVDITKGDFIQLTDDEKIDIAAKRVLNKYRTAFERLAQ